MALKRQLSPHLLRIRGVVGVGVGNGHVCVYLAEDDEAVRRAVANVVSAHAPGAPIVVDVSGPFVKQ